MAAGGNNSLGKLQKEFALISRDVKNLEKAAPGFRFTLLQALGMGMPGRFRVFFSCADINRELMQAYARLLEVFREPALSFCVKAGPRGAVLQSGGIDAVKC